MANTKVSELSAITSLISSDLLLVSQNSMGSFTSKKIEVDDLHSSVVTPVVTPISYSANITTDLSTGDIFTTTLTGDVGLENPTNGTAGKTYSWWIRQDGSGNHAITLGNAFSIPSSATIPLPWSTAAGKMDMLAVRYSNASTSFVVAMVPGYN